jgi:hypothetical protein
MAALADGVREPVTGRIGGGIAVLRGALAGTAITAAFALPACEPRPREDWITENDFYATACLRTYAGAQNMYRRYDWDGDGVLEYAYPYSKLNMEVAPRTGRRLRLIGDAFANASTVDPPIGIIEPKVGYLFVDLAAGASEGTYFDEEGNCVRGFGLCAYPAEYSRSGRYTYVIDMRFEICRKDTEGKPVTLFPDLVKDGWEPSTW